MSDNPNAEIVTIGTELLLGEITDTNSVFMARALRDIGINLYFITTVGDNLQRIADALDLALDRADIVITCGGLGPTVDDMTRHGVALATKRELEFHQSLFDTIAERFRGFGSTMTENNRQQAYLPREAQLIQNPVGTAPSFIVKTHRGVVISLPGVPREMKYLMSSAVIPYLLEQYNLGTILARVLRTAGIGESSLDDKIGKELLSRSNPTIGLAAHHGSVDVRITAKADTAEDATRMLDEMQILLQSKIGGYVFGLDDDTLEGVVTIFLKTHQLSLTIIEAGLTNAIISKLNTDELHPQSQQFSHPNDVYESYQMSTTLELKECAIQLATSLQNNGQTAATIVLLSYPDIDENSDTEQGSAIAIATQTKLKHREYGFGAKSNLAQDWIPRWGLSSLWRMLNEERHNLK